VWLALVLAVALERLLLASVERAVPVVPGVKS
jgi:hypothetical protein